MGVKSSERSSQACEVCRFHKLRCQPSTSATACQRCTNLHISCEPHLPNKRKRRSRKPYQELEERIDRLSKSLQTRPDDASKDSDGPPQVLSSKYSVPVMGSISTKPPRPHDDTRQSPVCEETIGNLLLDCLGVLPSSVSLTSLTEERASRFFDRYQELCEAFPFVLITSHTLRQVVTDRPFLTVAVLVVCSTNDQPLHTELDTAFRQSLGQRVIVEGRRSLELLQGLLLYLGWHQHYLRHEDQQVYQYLQLAIAMAVDLELGKVAGADGTTPSSSELDQARAFVGCYYLSCGYCVLGFRKPRHLTHSESIVRSAELLAIHGSHPHDKHAPALVKLMQAVEQSVNATTEEVNSLRLRLLRWKMECCGHDSPALHLTTYYHWQLTVSQRLGAELQNGGESACLAHAQSLLDHLLRQGNEYLHKMAQVEWIALISGTISLVSCSSDQTLQHAAMIYLEKELSIMLDLGGRPEDKDDRGVYAWYANLLQLLMRRLTGQSNMTAQQTEDEAPFNAVRDLTAQLENTDDNNAHHDCQAIWEHTAIDWFVSPLDLFRFPWLSTP